MIPKNFDGYSYPVFQPDQLLSADHLNHAFGFNEQEERLTRTNLIGIGIVCGMKVSKSADGSVVTITKGTGVTSQGYLITHGKENSEEPIDYRQWRPYNMQQANAYDLFWENGVQKYALYELLPPEEASTNDGLLSNGFLRNKVCLVFYEKMEVDAKNCDTTSCDDRGRTITVNIRKLLIHERDAAEIIRQCYERANLSGSQILFPLPTPIYQPLIGNIKPLATGSLLPISANLGEFILPPVQYTTSDTLPDLRMPRYDVTATALESAENLREAFQRIFSRGFIEQTGAGLSAIHQALKGYLGLDADPFAQFSQTFSFLHDGSITGNNLLHFQYFYDFFGDLLMAYAELKESSYKTGALCTPPEALFPRHLFLGKVGETDTAVKSRYRTYFIPSPVTARHEDAHGETLNLYNRLLHMLKYFELPVPRTQFVDDRENFDAGIRVTPSLMGKAPLGDRAIPYYYNPISPNVLLQAWNFSLGKRGLQHQNLGYHADTYNRTDGFVHTPLLYDLEPYNFFRVEGHIGKRMETVLATLQSIRDEYRLPFEVVPVNAGTNVLPDIEQLAAHFNDLELQYRILKNEISCRFTKARECICVLPIRIDRDPTQPNLEPLTLHPQEIEYTRNNINTILEEYQMALNQGTNAPQQQMLLLIDKLNNVRANITVPDDNVLNTLCDVYQKYKERLLPGDNNENILVEIRRDLENIRTRTQTWATVEVESGAQLVLMLSFMDRYQNLLADTFHEVAIDPINTLQKQIDETYTHIADLKPKQGLSCVSGLHRMCLTDDLNILYKTYQERLEGFGQRLTLAEFSKAHPGLQHKAGVPVGGTLILVYRQVKRVAVYDDFSSNLPNPAFEDRAAGSPLAAALPLPIGGTQVIADFFIPYICCSDSPSVHVTIGPPAQDPILFSLPAGEYCSDYMPARIPFTMSPLGGTIVTDTPEAVEYDVTGAISYFVPGNVEFAEDAYYKDLTFTYQVSNGAIPITVRVYRQPKVSIVWKRDEDNPRLIRFSLDYPEQVTQAYWNFGDGSTSASPTAEHLYTDAGKYKVTLQVWNGTCSAVPDAQQIEIAELEPIKVDLPGEFCQKSTPVDFTITPAGGTLSGVNFGEIRETVSGSGNYNLDPGAVKLDTVAAKTIPYLYTAPAGNTRPFSVTYYSMPSGKATLVREDKDALLLQFTLLRFVKTIRLFDGRNTQEYAPRGNNYNILLDDGIDAGNLTVTLHNGPCSIKVMEGEGERPQSCQLLNVPVDNFNAIRDYLGGHEKFMALYGADQYDAVKTMFHTLETQLLRGYNFALDYVQKHDVVQPKWIAVLPIYSPDTQTPSLSLLAVFTDLVTTISCIRRDDADRGEYTTIKQLEEIQDRLKNIQAPCAPKDLYAREQIMDDVDDEMRRLDESGTYRDKPMFYKKLQEIKASAKEGCSGTTGKSCQPLGITIDNFKQLVPSLQTEPFKQVYGDDYLNEIIQYFKEIDNRWKPDDPKAAIEFVTKEKYMTDTWINRLPVNHTELQTKALALLAILSDLLTTISCLKDEDTGDGNIPTKQLMGAVWSKVRETETLHGALDLKEVDNMLDDVDDEQAREETNGSHKPTFEAQLEDLKKELNALKDRSGLPQARSCQLLDTVLDNFDLLAPHLKADVFIQAYGSETLNEVLPYFEYLRTLWTDKNPTAIANFLTDSSVFTNTWIDKLPLGQPDTRGTAFGLMALLTDLATTVSCYKSEDANNGKVNTHKILGAVLSTLQQIGQIQTPQEYAYVQDMINDVEDEQARLDDNGDLALKPIFNELLDKLLEQLNILADGYQGEMNTVE